MTSRFQPHRSGEASPADPRVAEQLGAFRRNAVDLIEERELADRIARALAEGRPLRVKYGMDPSSPDLHVGHAIHLRKLRALQELGHTVVLIVGDATAMVGDPSGRNKLRPQLSRADVQRNLETYKDQARLVLDLERAEVRHNSEWFDPMGFEDVLRLCGAATVAQMLERDTFAERMKRGEPIGVHELLYPLMQALDSVRIEADVEIGGTDQLFNLLFGRRMMEQQGLAPQVCVTYPLIDGLDGRKMSKSYGNAIGIVDPPEEKFGRVMAIDDDAMRAWFPLLTDLDDAEIAAVLAADPREAKARLAEEITAAFDGREAAAAARAAFDRRFRDGALPDDIREVAWPGAWPAEGVPIGVLLREIGLASSSSEARRLVTQGGVRVAGEVLRDPAATVPAPREPLLVQVGKRRFARVTAGRGS